MSLSPSIRSSLILAATLAAGVLLGVVGSGRLAQRQRDQMRALRRPPGFVAHIERVIAPRDAGQRDAIRPLLEAAARRNEAIARAANEQLRTAADSLRGQLAPLLDAEQQERLTRELAGGPRRFGPDGGRRPPFGGARGGPPGGRRPF